MYSMSKFKVLYAVLLNYFDVICIFYQGILKFKFIQLSNNIFVLQNKGGAFIKGIDYYLNG